MTEDTRPSLDLTPTDPPEGNPTPPGPIPVTERPTLTPTPPQETPPKTPAKRRAKRRATQSKAPGLPSPKADRPSLFSPSLFYFLGALLTAVTWLAYLNPRAPIVGARRLWPWQLFREHLAEGGDPTFAWTFAHAVALVLALVILFYLIAALLKQSHGRGATALLVSLVPITMLWAEGKTPVAYTVGIVAAVAAGAVILRHDHRRLARGVLLVSTLLLGALLFFPSIDVEGPDYRAGAFYAVEPLLDLVRGDIPFGWDRLVSGDGMHSLLLFVLALLGLLAAFGVRRRWVLVAATVVLLLAVFLPPIATQLFDLPDARPANVDFLALVNQSYWVWTAGLALILVAALASWLGLGGRWATWLAGAAILLISLDQPATLFREAAGVPGLPDQVGTGIRAVGEHLSRGAFAAFLLPIAALTMDLARPRV